MLAIVRIALQRPYTFVVLALLILLVGALAALRTPVDIFPSIDIPIIGVAWQYQGLPPDQMSGRVVTPFERALTTTVNDIEHIESNSYTSFGIIKIFFHPTVNIAIANAQVTAISQTLLKQLPAGSTPPLIINYTASTVPLIQLALSGKGLTEQALADLGLNFVRTRLVTVQGAGIPYPFGGKTPQVMYDLDTAALQSRGLTGQDVANALAAQNLITPAGTVKIGVKEYTVNLNSAPSDIEDLGDLPIKSVDGAMVYMRDVAHVREGGAVQTNVVHVDGDRSVLLTVFKNGTTSTLAIVSGVKKMLETIKPSLPENLEIKPIGDQSVFVRASIEGVLREALIAAALTSLMILLFLGSVRSTLIVSTSIPLSILGAIAALSALGQTLNIMTLGGLALAVGILVDEATVTIESINYHLEQGKDVETAIMDGSSQIVIPAFVSLLCICIVFVPMFFLSGVARYLFVPLALSVVFAMIFSFLLSRTLVPTMAKYLLRSQPQHGQGAAAPDAGSAGNALQRFQHAFEERFMQLRAGYRNLLALAIGHRKAFLLGFAGLVAASFLLAPLLGRNFFPQVDAGQILMHVRVPVGTRIEETAARFTKIEKVIRQVIPPAEIGTVVDNIGTYLSAINTIYNNTGTIGESDGDIQISLNPGHAPSADYVERLRAELPRHFDGVVFSFLPADIVSQILNFGAPAPIDLQVRGQNLAADFAHAHRLLNGIRMIPGIADARIQQSDRLPTLDFDIDRTRAQFTGVTAAGVTNSLVVNLASSLQVAPTYWLNEKNGVTYPIALQTPQYKLDSLPALLNLPINASGNPTTVLGGIGDFKRSQANAVVSQYDISPMVEIYATTRGRDLGAVSDGIRRVVKQHEGQKPKGTTVALVGQVATMHSAYMELLFGLLGAIVLVYFVIVINFQSWTDPLIIISALPAALAGIVWMLFATGTTLSVPALTGAIMCMGVATANSVLVVSFAREKLNEVGDSAQAAVDAGFVRLRPVLMTALAMVIGMLPMALGLGEGGEQNAPLGRAVIGGLIFATVSTLFFVPVLFSAIHRNYRPGETPPSNSAQSVQGAGQAPPRRPIPRWLRYAALGLLLLAALLIVYRLAARAIENRHLQTVTHDQALPTVNVVAPKQVTNEAGLDLPGRLEAYIRAPIYARVPGYLKSWNHDIGSIVKKGDVLAEIDTPDLDQQLLQARANLKAANANANLAQITAERWQSLADTDAVAKQDVDTRNFTWNANLAEVKAMQASVEQLVALEGFKRLVAPFDGIVTARETDVGALINAGATGGQELFVVSETSRLRAFVNVPQNFVPRVPPGTHATITVPEHPGKTYSGTVEASAQAVMPNTGTTLMQIIVDNSSGEMMPGAFASIQLQVAPAPNVLSVPSSAVIFNANGLSIATLDASNHVRIKPVSIARDLGQVVEISSGLAPQDRVIENPPDGVDNGDAVRLVSH